MLEFFLYLHMNSDFYKIIANSSAHINQRKLITNLVCNDGNLLSELMKVGLDTADKNHHKAVWIFERLAENHLDLIAPYFDEICNTLSKYKHQSAIRGISRVLLFFHLSKKITFTEFQEEKITETCLDWLIGKYMIVPKVMAMHILFDFGKKQPWIHEELALIIERDYAKQTAGYQNRAKIILNNIKLI